MKTNIYHLIILDESGSMEIIKNAAITGCNETIQNIRSIQEKYAETQNHYVSLISFNSRNTTKIIFDKTPIENVNCLDSESYVPDCCTPLYDAMGLSFTHLQNTISESGKSAVLATIITDGLENASTIYDARKISSLIDELGKNGWTFAYIGANQDVVLESKKINITNNLAFETSARGTSKMFHRLRDAQVNFCCCIENNEDANDNLFDEK